MESALFSWQRHTPRARSSLQAGDIVGVRPLPYIITVNRQTYKLYVRKRKPTYPRKYVVTDIFTIAVGRKGFRTPTGYYEITKKEFNPTWTPPDEDWVGPELRDPETNEPITLPSDHPQNPLAGAFLWVVEDEAVGIHGTKDIDSLGSSASHGCIRVKPEVAVHLAKVLPLHTPVIIV